MAGHLKKAGTDLLVWNRTASKSEAASARGIEVAPTLEGLAQNCQVIILCVTRSEDVQECANTIARHAAKGTLVIDHSTIAPEVAVTVHKFLKSEGLRFVDAPITGGSMGAQKGQLTIFCGGEPQDVAEAVGIVQPYAKRAERVGGPGQGQMMKLANQIAVGGNLLAVCETLSFAKKAGLDLTLAKDMIGGGAGGSWAFDNYGPKILNADWSPGFSIKNQRKDFGYCMETAEQIDAAIPGTALVDLLLADLESEGHGEWTTAALYEALLEMGASS